MSAFRLINSTQGSGSGTSVSVTIPAVKANNLVIVNFKFDSSTFSGVSVTDNASTPNTYALAVGPIGGSLGAHQYYGVAVKGGATSVTVSWTTSRSVRITVDEYAGGAHSNAAVFDKAVSNTGTGGSSTVTLSPTSSAELIAVGLMFSSGPASVTPGSNYLMAFNGATSVATGYRRSGTTSETAPMSWSGSPSWAELAGAYIPLSTPAAKDFFAVM